MLIWRFGKSINRDYTWIQNNTGFLIDSNIFNPNCIYPNISFIIYSD